VAAERDHADRRALLHRIARLERRVDRLEGRDETVAVVDRQDAQARDHSRERNGAGCRRSHVLALQRTHVDAPMAGSVAVGGRGEAALEPERADRPDPVPFLEVGRRGHEDVRGARERGVGGKRCEENHHDQCNGARHAHLAILSMQDRRNQMPTEPVNRQRTRGTGEDGRKSRG
jgi:hypothetical protein